MPPSGLRAAGGITTNRNHNKKAIGLILVLATLALSALLGQAGPPRTLRSIIISDDFSKLDNWQFPYPEDWTILREGALHYLHMKRNREPGVPRRPLQFALFKGAKVGSFQLTTRLRREGSSMMIVFNYVDTLHFYYAHLSRDRGTLQPVHNGLFIVNGEPRVRIAGIEAPPALPDQAWHTAKLVRDVKSGSIAVYMEGAQEPLFSTGDRTFSCGQVGLGSFDETGDFADFRLESKDAGCQPSAK
jgi:hypothetical protein